MCPGMAAEALGLGDASAEKVEQDLASPWACWVAQVGFGFFVMRQLPFRNDSTGPKDGGATGLYARRHSLRSHHRPY